MEEQGNEVASFDRRATLERVGHDTRLLREIVELFRVDARSRLTALGTAIESGDLEAAREGAHALKGGVTMFDAPAAYAAAADLEELTARPAGTDALLEGLERLEAEYLRLRRDLERLADEA